MLRLRCIYVANECILILWSVLLIFLIEHSGDVSLVAMRQLVCGVTLVQRVCWRRWACMALPIISKPIVRPLPHIFETGPSSHSHFVWRWSIDTKQAPASIAGSGDDPWWCKSGWLCLYGSSSTWGVGLWFGFGLKRLKERKQGVLHVLVICVLNSVVP
jgi:hypothetical protein